MASKARPRRSAADTAWPAASTKVPAEALAYRESHRASTSWPCSEHVTVREHQEAKSLKEFSKARAAVVSYRVAPML
jgi:hypothetical protein